MEAGALTTDPELQAWIARDPLRGTATTARWFTASVAAQREVRAAAARFTAPMLLLAAGDDRITRRRREPPLLRRGRRQGQEAA